MPTTKNPERPAPPADLAALPIIGATPMPVILAAIKGAEISLEYQPRSKVSGLA
jgi:hypothetical protein